MRHDAIRRIEIKEDGRLCIWPEKERFDAIYRAAMEVHWDPNEGFLFGPKPREWSYFDWFKQILGAAMVECGVTLKTGPLSEWINIDPELKQAITTYQDQY